MYYDCIIKTTRTGRYRKNGFAVQIVWETTTENFFARDKLRKQKWSPWKPVNPELRNYLLKAVDVPETYYGVLV